MTLLKRRWRESGISTKIILLMQAVLLVTSILFCTVSIYRARTDIKRAIWRRMLDIVNCAAASVDGDYLADLSADDVGTKEYNDLYKKLAVFRDNVDFEYIYSLRKVDDHNYIFTMDLDPEDPAAFGDEVLFTEALAKAGNGTSAVDEEAYEDKWGEFYSAYSPVFDSSGKVAGVIAVDFSADWFDSQLSAQTRTNVISFAIILVISLLVSAVLSLITLRPFVKAQEQLLEEKVRAEGANRAKSDFLANMSHEIRTPINAMMGMNEMILRETRQMRDIIETNPYGAIESSSNILTYASDCENAGQNLIAIINDILDFSKIEEGRMDLVEAPYKISSLLKELRETISIKADDKGLEFFINVDDDLPDVLCGDEVRTRQVLTNLINNAVKYTEHGFVSLTVNGEKKAGDTFLLKAVVRDSGIGIKHEDLQKLFKRFSRLEMERNSTLEGTGLGLVITQRLLDMMNGTVEVESEYGKGSVFTVTIPQRIVSEDEQDENAAQLKSEPDRSGPLRAPEARILAVDDTRVNLTLVTALLQDTGITVDTALSGADAVAMAHRTHYDTILMDQRMPEMDGVETLKLIRLDAGGASAASPVICFTADAVVGAKERYLAEGFDDYMSKPITGYALEEMLAKHLPQTKLK